MEFSDLTYEAFEALEELIADIEGDFDFPQLLQDIAIEYHLERDEIEAVVYLYDNAVY